MSGVSGSHPVTFKTIMCGVRNLHATSFYIFLQLKTPLCSSPSRSSPRITQYEFPVCPLSRLKVSSSNSTSRMPSTPSTPFPPSSPGHSPRIQRSPASSYSSLQSLHRMPIQHLPAQKNMLQSRSTDDESEISVLSSSSGARIARDYQATANSTSPPAPPTLKPKSELKVGGELSWLGRFGSIELENKGSVARDHLALERTFLAWLRTSLAFASIGTITCSWSLYLKDLLTAPQALRSPNSSAYTPISPPTEMPNHTTSGIWGNPSARRSSASRS
jgi:hypothetical protein